MKARLLSVSYEKYLLDDIGTTIPTLNASTGKVIIEKSPAHAAICHPKLNPETAEKFTPATDKGSTAHSLLLNVGKGIHVCNYDNFRTKVAQEERDKARSDGFIPMLLKDAEEIQQAAIAVSRNITELGIHLDKGKSEFMIYWTSEEGVECRRSLDSWNGDKLQIIELKSIFCSHPDICSNQAMRLGYDIEYAASMDAITTLYPEYAGRIDFVFVFFELEPPYAVTALRPDGTFTHSGILKWERAKSIWQQCLRANKWPAYSDEIGILSAPLWAVKKEMEELYE